MSSKGLENRSPNARGPRIEAVDGLRATAMLMVFWYHTWQFGEAPKLEIPLAGGYGVSLGGLINSFTSGVDLFMVLSGFCLFWPIAKSPESARTWSSKVFAWRRIRRIVPSYYAAIIYVTLLPIVLVVVYRMLGQPAKWQTPADISQYVTHLLFIHTLFPSTWDGIQGAFWSLGLEAQFYAAFPFVVWGFRRFGIKVIWMLCAISILYRVCASQMTSDLPWNARFVASIFFLGRWMQFAAGMAAAWVVARGLPAKWCGSLAGTGMLLVAFVLYGVALPYDKMWSLPVGDLAHATSFAVAIIAVCATKCPARFLFTNRLMQWLGLISYSVFLIHQNTAFYLGELLKKVLHLSGPARFAVLGTCGLALIVGLSAFFYRFFEHPFLNVRKGATPKPSQSIAAQVTPSLS
jgi:peptidoglycan/LPS O-acetylase OafA/YrhL